MMTCPYCGPVEPKPVTYRIKRPEPGTLVVNWCPKCTACLDNFNEQQKNGR